MNVVLCASLLMLISEPEKWTECVLGHQGAGMLCVCYIPIPSITKCTTKRRCEVCVRNSTVLFLSTKSSAYPPAE